MTASSTRVGRSPTGLGLFATKPIKRGAAIATYRGRRISTAEAARREACGARYMFELNSRWTIDGSPRWNRARYINHSCRPNAEAVGRKGGIVIVAIAPYRGGGRNHLRLRAGISRLFLQDRLPLPGMPGEEIARRPTPTNHRRSSVIEHAGLRQVDELAPFHWITSVTWDRSSGVIVSPRTLTVLRLSTRSNRVGCLHRQVGGLGTVEKRPDIIDADLVEQGQRVGIVAHQAAAHRHKVVPRVHRRYFVAGCQLQYLAAIASFRRNFCGCRR